MKNNLNDKISLENPNLEENIDLENFKNEQDSNQNSELEFKEIKDEPLKEENLDSIQSLQEEIEEEVVQKPTNKFSWGAIGWIILGIFVFFGIILHIIPPFRFDETQVDIRPFLINIVTEPFLYAVNLILLVWICVKYKDHKRIIFFLSWFLTIFFLTLLLEIIGVFTGLIFGEYEYGTVFNIKLLGVPLIIGLNWVVLILSANLIADKQIEKLNPFKGMENEFIDFFRVLFSTFLASVLLVVFDWFLEPVAVNFGYWNWANEVIPLQNYIAWFFISFFFSLFYKFLKFNFSFRPLEIYFYSQLVFFAILSFIVSVFMG
jgi:putative membrane protein